MKKTIKTVTGFIIGQSVNDIQESLQNQQLGLRRDTTDKAFYERGIFKTYGSCDPEEETKHLWIRQEGNRPPLTKVNDPDPPESRILKDKAIANGEIHPYKTLKVLGGVA